MTTRPMPRVIRIVATGGPSETRVFDAETGEDLSNRIKAVYWQHRAGEAPRAIVTFVPAATEVVVALTCRHCGRAQHEPPEVAR